MSLDLPTRMLIELQCTALCYRNYYYIDTRDIDSLMDLYTEDAEIIAQTFSIHGREEIRSFFNKYPPGTTRRHIVTNLHFVDVQEDQAEAVFYSSVPHTMGQNDEGNPFMQARLFDNRDRYQRIDDGWRIRSHSATIVFAPKDWEKTTSDVLSKIYENSSAGSQ